MSLSEPGPKGSGSFFGESKRSQKVPVTFLPLAALFWRKTEEWRNQKHERREQQKYNREHPLDERPPQKLD